MLIVPMFDLYLDPGVSYLSEDQSMCYTNVIESDVHIIGIVVWDGPAHFSDLTKTNV